jgi:hypothetical protein
MEFLGFPKRIKKKNDIRLIEKISVRPNLLDSFEITYESLKDLIESENAAPVHTYFDGYPSRSFMSTKDRVVLYELVRALNAKNVAEVGTLFAGTSEVICRALHDNGGGVLHTTDPFGAHNKVEEILGTWPKTLSSLCIFSQKMSMDFFLDLESKELQLDLCLVDGNHDFEFALFDLLMASKLVRPGGVIVMDDSQQTGPFYATKEFLLHNPGWRELGNSVVNFSESQPFDKNRSSLPETSLLILKKPKNYLVQAIPKSTNQKKINQSHINGIEINIASQAATQGKLHVQVILRAFYSMPLEIEEYYHIFSIPVNVENYTAKSIRHIFENTLISELEIRKGMCNHTLELDMSWESDSLNIELIQIPIPIY